MNRGVREETKAVGEPRCQGVTSVADGRAGFAAHFPSCLAQCTHSAQVQRHTDEFPLCFDALQAPHAELPESQHVLDPAVAINFRRP